MDNTTLRKVQLTQLEIACEIKRICDENQIEYFIDGGTLLGAVRHKGFIPWDDDLDIGMSRNQYNKFVHIASKQLKDEFFLQTWDTDKGYGYTYAKVRKKNTIYLERVAQDSTANNGIFVDIFPYDNYPDNRLKRKLLCSQLTILKMILKVKCHFYPWKETEHTNVKRWFIYLPIRFFACFSEKEIIKRKYLRLATSYNKEKTTQVFPQVAERLGATVMKREYLEQTISMKFENILFSAPKEYDAYLTELYGDYMTPPPLDKRKNIHNIIKISFGECHSK